MLEPTVDLVVEGEPIFFRSLGNDDHILKVMRELDTFYEYDVLFRVRERLRRRGKTGAAIDAGGFIGTHSVFFAKLCGLRPVLTFEANPATFTVLSDNLEKNGLGDRVIAVNRALGDGQGQARVVLGPETNRGATRVELGVGGGEGVPMTTLDAEVEARGIDDVCLIKIDVEGLELPVLRGAAQLIARRRPVLCVEVHTAENLREVLDLLTPHGYWIVDCLGYSPTYVLEASSASARRRRSVNALWLRRAALRERHPKAAKLLRRLALRLGAGRFDPPPIRARKKA